MNADTLIQNENAFRLLIDAVGDCAIYMVDVDGHIQTWSKGAQRSTGYSSREVLSKHFSIFFPPEDAVAEVPQKMLSLAAKSGHFAGEGWRVRKDGARYWASVVLNAMHDDQTGELIGFAKVTRDLTERKLQEEALRDSEAALQVERDRLKITLHSICDGVITTDQTGAVMMMNPTAESMTGWTQAESYGRQVEEVISLVRSETDTFLANPVRACLAENRALELQEVGALVAREGTRRDIHYSAAPIRSVEGEVTGTVVVFRDVSELGALHKEAQFSATHDPVTMLPNRRHFESSLAEALQRANVDGIQHTLCMLDLDRFKSVNDTAGHAAGDALLRNVGKLLTSHVRGSDLVARIGGDEFAIILQGCTIEQAEHTLRKLMAAMASMPFQWDKHVFQVSGSIGVTSVTAGLTPPLIMSQADLACYAAKRAGRNRVNYYSPDQSESNGAALPMHVEIQEALAENRFFLVAQKILSLNGDAEPRPHYEILLRMYDRKGDLLSPAQFMPTAERHDMMPELDRWVLSQLFVAHSARLQAVTGLRLSVNLSANSLADPRFQPFLMELLKHSSLPASAVTLEVTETSLGRDLEASCAVLEGLRSAGCKVALDDFGAGLSSFTYLRSCKADFVKIDGNFIRKMASSGVDLSIVKSISDIAHQMQSLTIAEFVEDERTLQHVRDVGIDFAQGYALGRPEPFESIMTN